MHCGKSPPTQEEAEPGHAGAETKAAMAALAGRSRKVGDRKSRLGHPETHPASP